MQSRETLSTDRDFQHVSTVEYISNMVYELHVRGVSSYHQAEDPRFKTMTAEPLSRRTDRSDQAMLYPEFTHWLLTRPTSVDSMLESVDRKQASHIARIRRSRGSEIGSWFNGM